MMTNKKQVPALRFLEFEGDYAERLISEVTTWKSGGTPSKENISYWNGSIPWISASSMKGIEYEVADYYISEEGLKNGSKLASANTLLMLVRGSMLFNKIPIGLASRDLAYNQDVKNIEPSSDLVPRYLLQWFLSKEHLLLGMVVGTGIGAGKLETNELKNLSLFIPSLPEQQKIASFLTAVDEKIRQLTRKQALLEQYKKGVMQKIFSREIRFKPDDGGEYPEWEEKMVSDFAPLQRGFDLPVSTIEEGPYPVVFSNGILKYHKDYKVKGPGVVTGRSGTIGNVTYVKEDYWPHNTSLWVTEMHDNHPLFVYYFYDHFDLTRFASGSGVPTLNRNDVHSQIVQVPCIAEQRKIAAFFSAIDEKIIQVTTQLQQAQQWKKGLLQGMFV